MTNDAKPPRNLDRAQRLQAALRENLRRRKAQARARAEDKTGTADAAGASPKETRPAEDD